MNQRSDQCPSWCSGHPCDSDLHLSKGDSPPISDLVSGGLPGAAIHVFASQSGQRPDLSVHVALYEGPSHRRLRHTGFLSDQAPEAIARLVELLSDATPEVHREVANVIRQAVNLRRGDDVPEA